MTPPSKENQKIGFSIESIVGNDETTAAESQMSNVDPEVGPFSPPQTPPEALDNSPHTQPLPSNLLPPPIHPLGMPFSHMATNLNEHFWLQFHNRQQQQQQQHPLGALHHNIVQPIQNSATQRAIYNAGANGICTPPSPCLSPDEDSLPSTSRHCKRARSSTPTEMENELNPAQRYYRPCTPPQSVSPQSSSPPSPPAMMPFPSCPIAPHIRPAAPLYGAPVVMPTMPTVGLVRPFGMVGPMPGGINVRVSPPPPPPPQPALPDIRALPPYINAPSQLQSLPAHLLAAAQFQMAAAIQASHVLGPRFMSNPGMPALNFPPNPWLCASNGPQFRFPGSHCFASTYPKPKRIRTAFQAHQLMRLENTFSNTQYVVGAERKALAEELLLNETQVKVWFQNRRTKQKREKEQPGGSSSAGDSDDELIDVLMDDYPSDEEHETDASS